MKLNKFSIVTILLLTSLNFIGCGASDSESIGSNNPEQNDSEQQTFIGENEVEIEPLPQPPADSNSETPPTFTDFQD